MENNTVQLNCIICHNCKVLIISRTRHDFNHCLCGNVHIDGGKDYLKYGFKQGKFLGVGKVSITKEEDSKLFNDWNKQHDSICASKDFGFDEFTQTYIINKWLTKKEIEDGQQFYRASNY